MKNILSSTALVFALSLTPALAAANGNGNGYDAHERCKRDEDNRQVLGGVAGAVVGGVIGSQVSGNGARTEGSAIGAVIGGLAGVGIADKTVDCDPVYAESETIYASTPTQQYGSQTYGHSSGHVGSQPYGSSQTYGSQGQYDDRVTYSSHPVYSDPTYGAGAVAQGQTYATGHVTYPPSGNNSQYASRTYTASQPVRTYNTTQYSTAAPRYYSGSQPVTQRVVYTSPPQPTYVSRKAQRRRSNTHYHGRYSCDMFH